MTDRLGLDLLAVAVALLGTYAHRLFVTRAGLRAHRGFGPPGLLLPQL